jgi:hypothetical protein
MVAERRPGYGRCVNNGGKNARNIGLVSCAIIRYVDYELDVSRRPSGRAVIVDEEEFLEAAEVFGYSAEFRRACTEAAQEAVRLAEGWVARGAPPPAGEER